MGYRNLSPQAMVNISGPWLDPKQDRKIFTSLPLLAPLLPSVEEAHGRILTTQRLGTSLQQQAKALMEKVLALDATHDRKLRGGYNYLGALAEMTDDPAFAAALLDLRDRLAPAGLKAVARSYGDQAGDAKLLPSRLNDASEKLLKKLKTPEGPLSQVVDAWVAAALEIEKVEAQREQLALNTPANTDGATPREVLNARNGWIRVVRAIETNVALEKAATGEITERLLGRLRRESARADRRGRKGGAEGAVEPAPAGDAAPPAAGGDDDDPFDGA
ncbi:MULTISPECIES: hypothetical protein [Sorangium]|uniref:Uncharacterized protein n=1 Tax=Sorangium cellulosum TaxID=56 RepID=A0A4P2QZT0_SORCE|nr:MULTISPECIES: hypothetical protein [Sorangium]AUX36137.1 hypothetical protein SOCE836_083430 [Sorangium cellulosum]WCQ95440.1 hypothetical protein NQZ70_08216 [Sorangium sp. Soce836]